MKVKTLAATLLAGLFCGGAQAEVIFSDDFEGGDWSKWSGWPNATVTDDQNRAIFTTGDDINGATFSAFDGIKSGKHWGLYWYTPQTGSTYAEWTGTAVTALQGEEVTFDLQAFLSSNDSMLTGGNNTARMFIKFLDAEFNEDLASSEYKLLSTGAEDVWTAHQLTVNVPNDAEVMQVGIEVNQIDWGGGAIWIDAVVVSSTYVDTTAPTPDPMSFAVVPVAINDAEISMTATTATDSFTAVEYLFTCTTDNAFSSEWQSGTNYIASGLSAGTEYTFTVTARDVSAAKNETTASPGASATTIGTDSEAPSPDPMTVDSFDASPYSVRLVATPASDPSGVEYYFTFVSGDVGHNSAWQDSNVYVDWGVTPNSTNTYTVTARDKSAAQNATVPSAPVGVIIPDAPISVSLTDDLKSYTGDSSLIETRHELLRADLEVASVESDTLIAFDDSGAAFGTASAGDGGRNIIRTVASDYADGSFEFYATASGFSAAGENIFVGIGAGDLGAYGVPDWSPNGETTNASIIIQVQESEIGVWSQATNTVNNWDYTDVGLIGLSSGTVQRIKVEYDASTQEATIRLDEDFDGVTFTEDTVLGPFAAPDFPASSSRVYISGDDGIILSDLDILGTSAPIIGVDDLTVQQVAGGMQLMWTSVARQTYDVEYKTDLEHGTWTTDPTPGLSGISGTDNTISVTSTVDNHSVFYQVVTDTE